MKEMHKSSMKHIINGEKNVKLDQFGWEVVDCSPHSAYFASSDFLLFTQLKEFLDTKILEVTESCRSQ